MSWRGRSPLRFPKVRAAPMNIDADWVTAVLRALVYAGTILAAGSVLFALTFRRVVNDAATALTIQAYLGAALILVVEPVRYLMFQLAISGGDWGLAFSPDMRWMALEVPNGQASLLRIVGVLLIVVAHRRSLPIAAIGALFTMSSYAIEGHSASATVAPWLGVVLLAHVFAVHWWIGSLWPLAQLTLSAKTDSISRNVGRFGRIAIPTFAVLVLAGGIVFGFLVDWRLMTEDGYQLIFFAKLLLVALVLCLAAYNRFWITPRLESNTATNSARLRQSISLEWVLAISILVLTGFLTTTTPGMNH